MSPDGLRVPVGPRRVGHPFLLSRRVLSGPTRPDPRYAPGGSPRVGVGEPTLALSTPQPGVGDGPFEQ